MADETETAAQAFDKAINDEKPSDTMFANLGKLEVDEDSPAKGGGDDEPDIYADQPDEGPKKGESDDEDADDEDETKEDADEGEEDEEDPAALDQTYKVIVEGQEKEVSLREALEGYIRNDTFQKRIEEVRETSEVIQRAANDVVQNFEYGKQMIDMMEGQMKELVPPEPDWDKMFAEDPQKARNLQKYYQQVEQFKTRLQEQRQAIVNQQNLHAQQQLKSFADTEALRFARLNSKLWGTDPTKRAKDLQSMRRTALQEGFSEDEIAQVFDSRMLQVLLKASKYDRMMAARPKPVQQAASKPVTPGPGKRNNGRKGLNEAMKKLTRTGSIEDAAPVFDQIIRRG